MQILKHSLTTLILSVLAACGGGGTALEGSISGTATKGPVGNATLAAYSISDGQMGARIATAMTDANGNFTLYTGGYAGPVMLQATGGTYTDEARGVAMTMAPGDVMTAVLPSVAAGAAVSGVQVTPLTAMSQALAQHMTGGMTDANIAAANTAMGSYFSVSDILKIQPMNPLLTGSGAGASQDARNYGMAMAAMSQYAKTLGMSISSALVTAMMNDATDGLMDGKMGAGQISMSLGGMMGAGAMAPTAGTSGLATAMTVFMNSAANASGLTESDMAPLIVKLTHSTGQIR